MMDPSLRSKPTILSVSALHALPKPPIVDPKISLGKA